MKKKTLFALLLAAVMLLSGCSLVLKDSAVDAKQTIIDVNGEQVDKQTFLNAYNYTLTMQQYYAQMLQQFGGDGTVLPSCRARWITTSLPWFSPRRPRSWALISLPMRSWPSFRPRPRRNTTRSSNPSAPLTLPIPSWKATR